MRFTRWLKANYPWIGALAASLAVLGTLLKYAVFPVVKAADAYLETPVYAQIHEVDLKHTEHDRAVDSTLTQIKGAILDMPDIMDSPPNSQERHHLVRAFKKRYSK